MASATAAGNGGSACRRREVWPSPLDRWPTGASPPLDDGQGRSVAGGLASAVTTSSGSSAERGASTMAKRAGRAGSQDAAATAPASTGRRAYPKRPCRRRPSREIYSVATGWKLQNEQLVVLVTGEPETDTLRLAAGATIATGKPRQAASSPVAACRLQRGAARRLWRAAEPGRPSPSMTSACRRMRPRLATAWWLAPRGRACSPNCLPATETGRPRARRAQWWK